MAFFADLLAGQSLEDGHIAPRRDYNPHAPFRCGVLHCFGVDFLSNKEVLEVFSSLAPQQVEWLDDSSCNVIFRDDEAMQKAVGSLKALDQDASAEEPWTRTRLIAGSKASSKAAPSSLREFRLELRAATEADRKNPGHSGHMDSIYYAQIKEQQVLDKQKKDLAALDTQKKHLPVEEQRQQLGLRREKKRQRQNSFISKQAARSQAQGASEKDTSRPVETGAETLAPRLGMRGLLDPLLFMRVPSSASRGSTALEKTPEAGDLQADDLRSALRRAEAEYTAVLQPTGNACAAQTKRGREATPSGRRRERTPAGMGREGNTGAAELDRGQKRRPLDQEPRPVSEATPPNKRPEAMPQVEAFLKEHKVRCRRYVLHRTFRSVIYKSQKEPGGGGAEAAQPAEGDAASKAVDRLPPWEQYLHHNSFFAKQGHFMHTVAWEADGLHILAVIPLAARVDVNAVAKAIQKPSTALKQRKLKDIAKQTGFPIFVCPPFGHPKATDGSLPVLLVDSSIMELKGSLLFDCGSVGLCLQASELLRSTQGACVEGLATTPAKPLVEQVQAPSVEATGADVSMALTQAQHAEQLLTS